MFSSSCVCSCRSVCSYSTPVGRLSLSASFDLAGAHSTASTAAVTPTTPGPAASLFSIALSSHVQSQAQIQAHTILQAQTQLQAQNGSRGSRAHSSALLPVPRKRSPSVPRWLWEYVRLTMECVGLSVLQQPSRAARRLRQFEEEKGFDLLSDLVRMRHVPEVQCPSLLRLCAAAFSLLFSHRM